MICAFTYYVLSQIKNFAFFLYFISVWQTWRLFGKITFTTGEALAFYGAFSNYSFPQRTSEVGHGPISLHAPGLHVSHPGPPRLLPFGRQASRFLSHPRTSYTIVYLIFLRTTFLFNLIITSANHSDHSWMWYFFLMHYIHTYKNTVLAHWFYLQHALGNRWLKAGPQDTGGKIIKVKPGQEGVLNLDSFSIQFAWLN